ncbi:DUF4157 domain-containing protein [Streptomyces sp. NPDC048751]|uniref:DUF4157 domain-containing protein n=1 Tax=Streptomyces sp. NPDC048751 TaxID=3365591 RepID=UPI0037202EB8
MAHHARVHRTTSPQAARPPGGLDAGRPLESRTRAAMEPRFGHDLGHVRVHTDAAAAAASRDLSAEACTTGSHILFATGRYAPGTPAGDRLIAHELTHVDQQRGALPGTGGGGTAGPPTVASPDSPGEREARAWAAAWSGGTAPGAVIPVRTRTTAPVLQRQETPGAAPVAGTLVAFRDAVSRGEWPTAARLLGEMSPQQRQTELTALHSDTRAELRRASGVLDPTPGNPVIRQIETMEQSGAQQGSPPQRQADVASLSTPAKLTRAWEYAKPHLADDARAQLEGLFTWQSLAMMAAFAAVYIGSQVTPVGWVADALALTSITLSAVFLGRVVFDVVSDIVRFFMAVNATDEAQLRTAGEALSRAIAAGGVGLAMALLSRAVGKGGGRPGGGSPPTGYAEAVTPQGVRVWVPATAAQEAVAVSRVQQAAATYTVATPPSQGPLLKETEGARGPEVFGELGQELGPGTKGSGPGVRNAVKDAQEAGLVGKEGAPGKADAALQPHSGAPKVRAQYGVSGSEVQSAHIGPTAFLRAVKNYSRSAADTVLLRRDVHAAFDRHWLEWARKLRRAGAEDVTVAELYAEMLDAIQQIPGLEQRVRNALAWRLEQELFRDLGLTPEQRVPLPLENVKPSP